MKGNILVAYASTHGATQEVAEVIVEVFRDSGLNVDLQPARNVRSLEGYSAVVLGAPLYMFHLHRDALRFLSRYWETFTGGLPLVIFAGGPFGKGDEEEYNVIRAQLNKELAKFPRLTPLSVEVIGGRFDPTRLRFPWNLIPALKQMPPNDLRDWPAIRAWATGLVEKV